MESPKIKNIYFQLHDYELRNGLEKNKKDYFIGREDIIARLKFIIKNSTTNKGAYLVTGYRGMGKTSVVKRAISQVNINKEIKVFNFSLSQDEIKEFDLLRQISWELNQYIVEQFENPVINILKKIIYGLFFLLSLLLTFCVVNGNELSFFSEHSISNPFPNSSIGFLLLFATILLVIFLTPTYFLEYLNQILILFDPTKRIKNRKKIVSLNKELKNRLLSTLEERDNLVDNNNPITYFSSIFSSKSTGNNNSKIGTLNYEKASTKEVEQYLVTILKCFNEYKNPKGKSEKPSFLFVIDELDKIEPDYTPLDFNSLDDSKIHQNNTRSTKIVNLLANLKSFLNTAEAQFIFVGGRDMYDAYLADIADRESFYSSIFKEVIYVPSFFKDKLSNNSRLTEIAESYLCSILYEDVHDTQKKDYSLNRYFELKKIKRLTQNQKFKIAHTLQNYILYLTYRCNGSPKKLIELIESHIVNYTPKKGDFIIPTKSNKGTYLKMSYKIQYEINLHSNIYRPYTIKNSQHHKSYSDKLLYTTAYLFDHILKFHNTAFSWDNLERLPDLVLANNDPNFRTFYSDILNFLTHQHLRKTTNAVFQYKFNSKIANEIKVCSKLFEQSAAAFNFALNESLHTKNHYYNELKKLKDDNFHSSFQKMYLHSILGDLYFYDGEYDDAITHYSKACLPLKQQFENEYTFALEVKNSMLLGLCFTKNKMFNQALAVFRAMIEQCKDLPNYYDKKKQIYQRPFIAELSIFEKYRQNGITHKNLEDNFKDYCNFLIDDWLYKREIDNLFPITSNLFESKKDERVNTLIADYYFSVGNILYFKNNKDLSFNNYEIFERDNNLNAATYYYTYALCTFTNYYTEKDEEDDRINMLKKNLNFILDDVKEETIRKKTFSSDQYDFIGNILTKLADSILSSINQEHDISNNIYSILLVFCNSYSVAENKRKIKFSNEQDALIINLSQVFKIYRLAYLCFLNAGKLYSAIYQYKKVLYVIRDTIKNSIKHKFLLYDSGFKNNNGENTSILDRITLICINMQTEINEVSNRRQITKYRMQLKDYKTTSLFYNNLSTSPEIKEYIYLNQTIKIKLGVKLQKEAYIGEYSTISSMFTRITELKYIGDKYRKEVENLPMVNKLIVDKLNRKDTNQFILINNECLSKLAYAFFAYNEILRIIKIYGINYILNHSFKAAICQKMARVCVLIEHETNSTHLDKKLKSLVGESYKKLIDDFEYINLAKYHYEEALSTHSQGNQYNILAKEMYFLNDDFNDNLIHFCAATERYRIGITDIPAKIKELEGYLTKSRLNNFDSYI